MPIKKESEFRKLARSVQRIETALLGEGFEGDGKGMMHYHNRMREDMYGEDPDGKPIEGKSNTILKRLSREEDTRKHVTWIFTGMTLFWIGLKFGWGVLVELLSKLFKS